MPNNPGQHGAKLTLFMPEISNFDPTDSYPLFVKRGTRDYMYYGTYKQPRYSDRLSYAEMELEVPRSVKEHRAKELGKKGKAKWIVDAMKYQGVVETDEEAEAFGPKDILQAFQRVCEAPFLLLHERRVILTTNPRRQTQISVYACIGNISNASAMTENYTTL